MSLILLNMTSPRYSCIKVIIYYAKKNSYRNHRIRTREHQQYGLILETMGPIPRPRSTSRGLLQYDPCQQHWAWRSYGYCWDSVGLLGIRIHDPRCSNANGRNGVLSSCTAFTLVIIENIYIYINIYRVEFQNKFYKADGYLFIPFSYVNILN